MELPRHPHVDLAVRYHRAVARRATGAELAQFFHVDAVHRELPNALLPGGAVRDLTGILDAAERGRKTLSHQHFEIVNAVAAGDQVALEVVWTGTLAAPLGELPEGHVLRAHIATIIEFRDGKIFAQRNYDCYETAG
ncbi:nuclear transport factor 2 family protein [Amycolatopsis anabasis]|uniref:nuclear transport factor 2 family protein n=1 Tax=Amycolatopsis anabasis TaxID=1840409 RepID=UPI001C55160A|nr:nuclear transport factor 2 family protein [Amycolatopsis anabasis]